MDRSKIGFTIITVIIGFMLAIQFQHVKEPTIRDTRDTWQLREDLQREKEIEMRILSEIRANEDIIAQYELNRADSKEQILRDTLEELKKEAGLTEVSGYGIKLEVDQLYKELLVDQGTPATISPDLLKRLINELNMYGAKHISIDGRRLINTTVIRDINGETKVDGYSLRMLPFEIIVITDSQQDAEKLFNRMQVSRSIEEFFIDNLQVKLSIDVDELTVPAYDGSIRIRDMEPVTSDEGGSS